MRRSAAVYFWRADGCGEAHERGMCGGQEAAQAFQIRGDAPEKYSRVPEIFARGYVAARHGERGLFRKAANSHCADAANARSRRASFDVTVTRFGSRGWDPEDHQIAWSTSQIQRGAHELAIACGVGDVTVRRQDGHQRVAVLVLQMNCRERNGRGGVATNRLGENVRGRNSAKLAPRRSSLFDIGDHPEIAQSENRFQARDGFAQHGLAAGDVQQLLGRARAAARPKTSAASARKQHGACGKRLTI